MALALSACGSVETGGAPIVDDPGPVHVHGLGVNPSDDALFIATHTGLFRVGPDEKRASRVAGRYQDTMAFSVVGSDRFLGSGHPDGREDLPPFLGLIESTDAGNSWRPRSLEGRWDFHLLETRGLRLYGFGSNFDTRDEALLVSLDGGNVWAQRATPETFVGLAMDPRDPDRLVASSARRLYASTDAGQEWHRIRGVPGLLAWPERGPLYLVARDGSVLSSDGRGGRWRSVGHVGGEPSAVTAEGATELYVALHDGTVKRSTDGGRSWRLRSAP